MRSLFVFACGLMVAASARAELLDARVTGGPRDNFIEAGFRLWVDDAIPRTQPLRVLLVLAPGWNGDGRYLAQSQEWQTWARSLNAAIVGVYLRGEEDQGKIPYHHAHRGSGAAWRRALNELASSSRRPEVAKMPWLLWGHSAGGQFAYGLACLYPERVAAFVAVKGGIYETPIKPPTRGVPGLFIIGENDEPWRAAKITELFERERREGSAWALAWETGAGHEIGQSSGLARAFLQESLRLRLDASGTLRRLSVGEGWTGERASYRAAASWPKTADDHARTVWLPGVESAAWWQKLGDTPDSSGRDLD